MAAVAAVSEEVKDEQVVVLRLGTERYGIDIFRVNEIIRLREITPLPHTAPHVRGLVNLRGRTIPVVDLRVRLGMDCGEATGQARIIVVEAGSGQVGLIVDEVCEVGTLDGGSIEPPPGLAEGDFVRGVARRGDRLVALLDLDRTLESP
ncbi:purine-binding chemotaxis protein CheW [bacterium]|nr:MAG: purine-binding chemotaxis protein CheW [bacterium]